MEGLIFKRDAEDLTLTKIILKAENDALIDRCKAIEAKKQDLEQTIGWLAQRKKRIELQRDINKIKGDFIEFQEVKIHFWFDALGDGVFQTGNEHAGGQSSSLPCLFDRRYNLLRWILPHHLPHVFF